MFTKQDKEFLKDNFATKDDLIRELNPIKKDVKSIKNKLDTTIDHFDRQLNYHHRRLQKLERHTGLEPPPYIILPTSAN